MDLVVEKNVMVPMRDGVELATDVYRPAAAGAYPVLINRLPYDKDLPALASYSFDVLRGARSGHAVVVQDTRGRYRSGGDFTPFVDDADDGEVTVAWAARQPWSSGRVGMIGGSYFGTTQWLAATRAPAGLRAIAPFETADQLYDGWAYQGGAFQLGFNLNWCLSSLGLGEMVRRLSSGGATPGQLEALVEAIDDNDALYARLPLVDMPVLDEVAPYYRQWLSHPMESDYWRAHAVRESWSSITVPALNMGGWYDLFLKGTIANYLGMRQRGGSARARDHQRLVIGPWAHGPLTGWFPEHGFGLMSGTDAHDLTGIQLRWFDEHLSEVSPLPESKPVEIFVMGVNSWQFEDEWPLPDTQYVDWFLDSDGQANSAAGNGRLSTSCPRRPGYDAFLYDPRHPVPTVGGATYLPGLAVGANAGPRDQRRVEDRADVLCYTSEPLSEPLTVIGPVELVLLASSSALDTDFTAKLIDVRPDGTAINIAEGILRARYRYGFDRSVHMEAGEIYEMIVDLVATANVFAVGHRLRLEVSSSNFPRFDRNTNTGGDIATDGTDSLVQAVNRVHHGPVSRSRLVLPVIRR